LILYLTLSTVVAGLNVSNCLVFVLNSVYRCRYKTGKGSKLFHLNL